MTANSPDLPDWLLPCSIPKIPLQPFEYGGQPDTHNNYLRHIKAIYNKALKDNTTYRNFNFDKAYFSKTDKHSKKLKTNKPEDIALAIERIIIKSRQRSATGQATGPTIAGDVFLAVRRFVPDFKDLQGNCKVTLAVKRYPQQSSTATALSPFTIAPTTDKKDTRARGRYVNIKIENDDISQSWRFGTFKIDVQPDGRR